MKFCESWRGNARIKRLVRVLIAVLCVLPTIGQAIAKKPITFLVYMAADNNLNVFVQSDLQEMMQVGSNSNLNVLVYLNTKMPGQAKVTRKLVVNNGSYTQDGPDEVRDSGSEATLIKACEWALTTYPSDKFILVLWDHGSGSLNRVLGNSISQQHWWARVLKDRSVCYDDTTGNFLTDVKLRNALSTVCSTYRQGKKIDILAFDACLMADIEVGYTVQPYVDFMVGSQQTIPGEGFGYDLMLRAAADGTITPTNLAKAMVQAYAQEYNGITDDYTLSAVDLSKLTPLIENMNTVALLLVKLLSNKKSKSQMYTILKRCAGYGRCTRFDERSYMDIGHFYRNLISNIMSASGLDAKLKQQIVASLSQGLTLLSQAVVAQQKGRYFPQASGLSVYFDMYGIESAYTELLWTKNTQWINFLRTYFAKR